MAERRMFAKTIIDSDSFLDMPMSARLLYYDLGMRADDDGFVNSPKKIQRVSGCSDDDIKLLIAKKFIIPFESGIVVVKHWKINNLIRSDRYNETKYKTEKSMLELDENNSYRLTSGIPNGNQLVYNRETQVRLGKVSIDKDNIKDSCVSTCKKSNKESNRKSTPELEIDIELKKELKEKTALESAVDDFKEFRKKIKAPMTDKAIQLFYTELDKLASDDETKIAIINQSILKSYKGVFSLKDDKPKQTSSISMLQKMYLEAEDEQNRGY